MKKILALLTLVCSFAALGQPERSLFDIEHELKRIILVDFSEKEAIERRAQIEPLISGARHKTQFLYELSACGIESNTVGQEWLMRANELVALAQELGSKELEMYARFCRAYTLGTHDNIELLLADANIIGKWAESNLSAYKHLAFANRIRLLAYSKSNIYTAADSYRDIIIGMGFASGPNQIVETKIILADLLTIIQDFQQVKRLHKEIEELLGVVEGNRLRVELYLTKSTFYRSQGQFHKALEFAEKATNIAEKDNIGFHASVGYVYQTLNHGELGNIDEALSVISQIPEDSGYLSGNRRQLYLDLALSKIYSEDYPFKALPHAKSAYQALRELSNSQYRIKATLNYAELLAKTNQWQLAAQLFEEYVVISKEYLKQVQSQYNDVTNIRFQFEQQRHQKQQASLQHQLQQQQIQGLEANQKWQILAIGTFLTLFLMMAASALHYRRRNKHSLESVSVDQLTQLANRNEIIHLASQALVKAQKSKQPISIALLDIESFRSVNDNFGVEIGDQILAEFAEVLAHRVGSKGMLGRYGGDEFMVVLPSVIAHEAETICAELLAIIQQTTFRQAELEIQLSVSFGISSSNAEAVSVSTLLTRAEDGLATAKQQGGSKVVSNAIG